MIVYEVVGSTRIYGEYQRIHIGIFSTPEKADEAKRLFQVQEVEYKSRYSKEEDAELNEKYSKWLKDDTNPDDLPEDIDRWWEWRHSDVRIMNDTIYINEIEVDKMLYTI